MVADLKHHHHAIVLRLVASIDLLNLHQREADIAIRSTEKPDESLFGLRLTGIRAAAYAAPTYIEKLARNAGPQDMEWIGHFASQKADREHTEYYRDKTIALSTNDKLVAARAARAGLGVANLPCYYGDGETGLGRVDIQIAAPVWSD